MEFSSCPERWGFVRYLVRSGDIYNIRTSEDNVGDQRVPVWTAESRADRDRRAGGIPISMDRHGGREGLSVFIRDSLGREGAGRDNYDDKGNY